MDREAFEALVGRAEAHANRDPRGYRTRVLALGALGHLYIGGLLVLSLGLLAVVGWLAVALLRGGTTAGARIGLEFGVPLLLFVVVLVRALWIRIEPPEGIRLERAHTPRLFQALEEIRASLDGPRVDVVLLDDRLNAAITQIPRLGIFGWHRNFLILGLPLLRMLSPEEAKAVLAHEYGHLSGSHGKTGAWVYRVRATWARLHEALSHEEGIGSRLLRRFSDWYAPYFGAYSFALARAQEYEADAAAAAVAGPGPAAHALIRLDTVGPRLDREHWNRIFQRARHEDDPPSNPLQEFAAHPALRSVPDDAPALLEQALARETDSVDTHPSLGDRLRGLGVDPIFPPPPEESAAEVFLGERLQDLTERLEADWRARIRPWWEGRRREVVAAQEELERLRQREGSLTLEERVEVARLTTALDGRGAAVPAFQAILEEEPGHLEARFALAVHELEDGEEARGVREIERLMKEGDELYFAGGQALRDHFATRGDSDTASRYQELLETRMRVLEERHHLPLADVYEPHGLPDPVVAEIVEAVEEDATVRDAYLVRRQPEGSPDPVILLAVSFWRSTRDDPAGPLARALSRRSVDVVLVPLVEGNRGLLEHIRHVEGAQIV
ncbi:MAG: M48 family metallopeptidase [Gemmatimonadota bacterium]